MHPQPQTDFTSDPPSSGTTDQKTRTTLYAEQRTDRSTPDGELFFQRLPNRKLFLPPWSRLLSITFTSLAAAYFLLTCFRFAESARRSVPQIRSLGDRRYTLCDWGNAAGDSEKGDNGAIRVTAANFGQHLSEEGTAQPHHQFYALDQSTRLGQDGANVESTTIKKASGTQSAYWTEEREQYGLEYWKNRHLPWPVKERLKGMFSRMVRASRQCRSLLPILTSTQRLRLAYLVMRLLALDLGAISLVRLDIEPSRASLGDALLTLGFDCLRGSGNDAKHDDMRRSILQLMALVDKLRQPRHIRHEFSALKYRKKMVSMMGTAGLVLKNCLGVLDGLLQSNYADTPKLTEDVVEQQFSVLEALYNVHADHISKDYLLREYILWCQEQTGERVLLDNQLEDLSNVVIPKLNELKIHIKDTIKRAGGLLPLQEKSAPQHESASSIFVGSNQPTMTHPETQLEEWDQLALHESFGEMLQKSLYSTGSSATTYVYGGTSLPSDTDPLWPPAQPPQQGAEPVEQVPLQLSRSPGEEQPDSGSSQFLQQLPSSPTPWFRAKDQQFQTPERQIAWVSSSADSSFLPFAPHSAETGFSVGPLALPTAAGRDIEPLLAPTTQLLQWTQVDSSARHQSPAASTHKRNYNLFGQGGVPPWSPFSLVPAASVEEQAAAGRGWVDAQMQDMRDPSTDDLDESESRQRSGRLEFGHQ
ncbi:hypothetical protein, conserved [Eimeria tenella]|uniref:Uncharacterized protein n=1 Tax=Eimeria tenella TaxID=5802 RepID=C8TDY2_EIMTE|nr:hypothetical protein, conserved [Eimeria tenella]CAK51468.1 hypothetical protein e2017b09.tmp0311 [Eimeria tenella]CDJ42464.1 hypothetical protein, conserved [Eimeria tenella]|eukprot:XP_013233214.1 hypothetical protein, conserved [Eimeria tenella]